MNQLKYTEHKDKTNNTLQMGELTAVLRVFETFMGPYKIDLRLARYRSLCSVTDTCFCLSTWTENRLYSATRNYVHIQDPNTI